MHNHSRDPQGIFKSLWSEAEFNAWGFSTCSWAKISRNLFDRFYIFILSYFKKFNQSYDNQYLVKYTLKVPENKANLTGIERTACVLIFRFWIFKDVLKKKKKDKTVAR